MKTLIIYTSMHNGNTKKIADAIAEELNGDIVPSESFDDRDISKYDLIGLGSGIYSGDFHSSIMEIIGRLGDVKNKRFFIFSTSGIIECFFNNFNKNIRNKLLSKGARIVGAFNCRGYDSLGLVRHTFGLGKNRPDENDIKSAKEFARTLKPRPLTLCLSAAEGRILLGMKKRGFGEGKWNGFGGKVEEGESIIDAARRELLEESEILATELEELGLVYFDFLDTNRYLEVHIFDIIRSSGEPKETREMRPQWFYLDEIPFESMWADDIYWMPLFLQKKKFKGKFVFENTEKMVHHDIIILN